MNPRRSEEKSVAGCRTVEFWPGKSAEIDMHTLSNLAVPVKGMSYHSPLRFLEIYANTPATPDVRLSRSSKTGLTWRQIEKVFLPRIPGVDVVLGADVPQPPFAWRTADANHLAVSFTYNTNAFFRIFNTLSEEGKIASNEIESFLDRACVLLSRLYRAQDHFLIRNINNNFNMYLISKAVEFLVGKKRYNSECQELRTVRKSLAFSLSTASHHERHSVIEKMGIAVGSGVCFMESRMHEDGLERVDIHNVQEVSYQFYRRLLAIDHRKNLLEMIDEAGIRKNSFTLAVILDDATETVVDLLWLQDLMDQFPFFKANLLVNTAQISINFSSHLLKEVSQASNFRSLISKSNSQFLVTKLYCPFISFQTSLLPSEAIRVIQEADAVYIKGANFFETCQIPEKESFHGFVVYGPISRSYTGLQDFDGVFAQVPAGTTGYHNREPGSSGIISLADIVEVQKQKIDRPNSLTT